MPPPKDIHILTPRICEYFWWHGKGELIFPMELFVNQLTLKQGNATMLALTVEEGATSQGMWVALEAEKTAFQLPERNTTLPIPWLQPRESR